MVVSLWKNHENHEKIWVLICFDECLWSQSEGKLKSFSD